MTKGRGKARQWMGTDHLHVLEFGPRYARPLDATMTLGVFHRTTDGRIGVLLDPVRVGLLADFLNKHEARSHHQVDDLQTHAELRFGASGDLIVKTWWNGSRRSKEVTITPAEVTEIHAFLIMALAGEWDGWRYAP